MKSVLLSDLHGHLPSINEEADLVLIAGDITPLSNHTFSFQNSWFYGNFIPWANSLNCDKVIFIAGNHDFMFQKGSFSREINDKVIYLEHDIFEYKGLQIFGTPYQPVFCDWAFNVEDEKREKLFSQIHKNVDILISHAPPFRCLDVTKAYPGYPPDNVGCKFLRKYIEENQPQLCLFGHIHESFGSEYLGKTLCVNASYVDSRYRPRKSATITFEHPSRN